MDIEYQAFDGKPALYDFINENIGRIGGETADITAVLANIAALLKLELAQVNWAGFYLLKEGRLVLGPFQGKPAVAEIDIGRGVCGTAVAEGKTQLVEDVHACCNHIACDFSTASEIVVPIYDNDGQIFGVIDIDSPIPARFDSEDQAGLEKSAALIKGLLESCYKN